VTDAPDARPNPVLTMFSSRMKMFFREPSAVFWTFGFPIVLTIALGTAFRNRPPEAVRAAVERGPGAEQLLAALAGSREVKAELVDPGGATRALASGRVAIVVAAGAPRLYRFDPTRPESRLARLVVDDVLQRADGRADPTRVSDEKLSEPGARYIDFLVPGLLGMNVLSGGMWGVGYVIVETRTRKLIKRMLATPMRRWHFLLSYVVLRNVFLLLEVPVLLAFARLAFGVTIHGSLALFFGLTVLGSFAFAGLGLLVASRAENTATASGLMNLVMMPMFICSGVFFSTRNFPDVMQPIIKYLPLTVLNDALRAIANDGAGLRAVALPSLILAAWALVAFTAALKLFRWR
jgi:ABC-type multidrug transport system permease subunit